MFASARRTLVTGASRPLGVELVRQCLERGDRVIAAARNPARAPVLADLRAKYGGLDLVALDPADAASVAEDYAACASGAAYNMLARALAHDLTPLNIIVGIGNPGKFATTPDASVLSVPIEESVTGLLGVIEAMLASRAGAFVDWTGAAREW